MKDQIRKHWGTVAVMAIGALWAMQGFASAALSLDGSETPAEVITEVWAEYDGTFFAALGALFGVAIVVRLVKRGLKRAAGQVSSF